jgi:hypothetical protein
LKQTNARQTTKTNLQAAPQPADDDPVPENIDEFRTELARRISRFIGDRAKYWRGCKEPLCRRRRACFAPRIRCSNAPPLPPSTPEQRARTSALIQRALREVLARREQGGAR